MSLFLLLLLTLAPRQFLHQLITDLQLTVRTCITRRVVPLLLLVVICQAHYHLLIINCTAAISLKHCISRTARMPMSLCMMCTKNIGNKQQALKCDSYKTWSHTMYNSLTDRNYRALWQWELHPPWEQKFQGTFALWNFRIRSGSFAPGNEM